MSVRAGFHTSRIACAALLGGAIVCVHDAALAFRTGADLPELETDAPVRWERPQVEFIVGGDSPRGFEVDGVGPTLRDAMGPWNAAACGKIALSYAGVSSSPAVRGDGVNTVSFVYRDWHTLAASDAAATTDVVYERIGDGPWAIVEADIYVNAQDYAWAAGVSDLEVKDLRAVLLHELGHALGLLHPCEIGGGEGAQDCNGTSAFDDRVMFPGYRPENRALAADDKAGLCFLYGCPETCGNECNGPHCAPPLSCDTEEACATAACASHPYCAGTHPLGDPCEKGTDCTSGYCSPESYCAPRCTTAPCEGDDCSPACEEQTRSPLGSPCEDSSTCLGKECLVGASPTNLCTRACTTGINDCPGNWVCAAVEAEPVCVPPDHPALIPTGGGGCSTRFAPASFNGWWIAALAAVGPSLRRRFRRSNKKSKS